MSRWIGAALAVLWFTSRASAQEGACPPQGIADELLRCALSNSSAVQQARAEAEGARGKHAAAERLVFSNLELGLYAGWRESGGSTSVDLGVELTQRFEIAGQRGARITSAAAELRGAEGALAEARHGVAAEVREGFVRVWRAIGVQLSLPIPFFARNQAELAEQRATAAQARAKLRLASLEVRLELRAALAAFERARTLSEAVPNDLAERLRKSTELLVQAYKRGALPLAAAQSQLREVREARAALLDTTTDAALAAIRLARAVAQPLPEGSAP